VADLTADAFLNPLGRLIPRVHFPGQSLKSIKAKLVKVIAAAKTEGADTADPAKFQVARVYERMFDEVQQRLLVVASDVSVDEGRRAYSTEQLTFVQGLYQQYAAEATALLDAVVEPSHYPTTKQSYSIGNRFTGPRGRCPPVTTEADVRRGAWWSGQ
jgi:hypothetical protein